MSEFTQDNIGQIVEASRENAAAIAEGLNQCFDLKKKVTVKESSAWDVENLPSDFDGQGVVVSVKVDDQYLFALIPKTIPLPDWYRNPGESESSRLQTLAMEWSMNLVPVEMEAAEFATVAVENLKGSVSESEPEEWVTNFTIEIADADGSSSQIVVVWPVKQAPVAAEIPPESDEPPDSQPPEEPPSVRKPAAKDRSESPPLNLPPGISRILKLPVKIVVCLAERQIDMDQLLNLSPGGLITFSKSCEDFLDLYVNNRRYCRGEAVKIGEKFGLKVVEVGVVDEREDPVLHDHEE